MLQVTYREADRRQKCGWQGAKRVLRMSAPVCVSAQVPLWNAAMARLWFGALARTRRANGSMWSVEVACKSLCLKYCLRQSVQLAD